MKLLALDFDGVLVSSVREVFVVGLSAYRRLRPDSDLAARIAARRGDRRWSEYDIEGDPVFPAYRNLLPLGNRAEDFGAALRAIDEGVRIPDQAAYDQFFAGLDGAWLERFHRVFYEERRALRDRDREGWIALHSPFSPVLDLLRARSDEVSLAVVTAKDGSSVRLLLDTFGAGNLIRDDRLLDKETGVRKTAHLRELYDRTGTGFPYITFVDDKLNHLEHVAPLGVRPVLAAWGYNSDREQDRARELGFAVVTLDSAEEVLFGA